MVFEETELRLGLPGNGGGGFDEGGGHDHVQQQQMVAVMMRKRGFSETQTQTADEREGSDETSTVNAVDLKLNLSNSNSNNNNNNKDIMLQAAGANHHQNDHKTTDNMVMHNKEKNLLIPSDPANPPAAKAQVVGWPPVRSFRKNMMAVQKSSGEESEKLSRAGSAVLVKVSMDGAPYLRKVDLNMYKNYQELSDALGKMFSSFSTIGNCGSQGMKDFMNESKLMDVLNGSDYVPTYEDKDGDWMLVGDVPWEMFVESCKRLRIMKGKEAVGLAPRAMEKCKNRS